MSLLSFWALNVSVTLLSKQGQKPLGVHQKFLNLCSEDERRSYGFGTTWGWVINDSILILGWIIHLIVAFHNIWLVFEDSMFPSLPVILHNSMQLIDVFVIYGVFICYIYIYIFHSKVWGWLLAYAHQDCIYLTKVQLKVIFMYFKMYFIHVMLHMILQKSL